MAPNVGLEPTTLRLRVSCLNAESTTPTPGLSMAQFVGLWSSMPTTRPIAEQGRPRITGNKPAALCSHLGCSLRPVKPCPGVPGIHLNADRTVSMTAALLCGAGASPVHKDRGCSADHDQIEDHAHAQRHAWEMLLWLKNGAHGRRARLARARTP